MTWLIVVPVVVISVLALLRAMGRALHKTDHGGKS